MLTLYKKCSVVGGPAETAKQCDEAIRGLAKLLMPLKDLEQRDHEYTRLTKELREKGLSYTVCAGCGWAREDHPEVVLEAVKGRDCGCPTGSDFAVRTVSRKRTLQEIEAWVAENMPEGASRSMAREGYRMALRDLLAFLGIYHAKTYECDKCRDEKTRYDMPTKLDFLKYICRLPSEERWRRYCEVDDRLNEYLERTPNGEENAEYERLLDEHECWWLGLNKEEKAQAVARAHAKDAQHPLP